MARKAAWRKRYAKKKRTLKCGCIRHNWGLVRCATHLKERHEGALKRQAVEELKKEAFIGAWGISNIAIAQKVKQIKIRNMPLAAKP